MKEVADLLAAGTIGEADARVTLLEALRALGYTPEGGFPDAPAGKVPPALRGTLQDLRSFRRMDLIVRTQRDLMQGAGSLWRAMQPDSLAEFPAFELIRMEAKRVSRDLPGRWAGPRGSGATRRRWGRWQRWWIGGGERRNGGRWRHWSGQQHFRVIRDVLDGRQGRR
jgi:hypothetical protein